MRHRDSPGRAAISPPQPRSEGWGGTAPHQAQVRELLPLGLARQAHRLARFDALRHQGSTSATLLAGRVAPILGSERLGAALVLRALRQEPTSPQARYHAARVLLERQGSIVTWLRMRAWGQDPGIGTSAPASLRADWLALRGIVAGRFRDFQAAEVLLKAAERMAPGRASTRLARADLLLEQDRRDLALHAAREALRLCPWSSLAAQKAAHVLQTLGQGKEALDLLRRAVSATEDSRLLRQLARHLLEEGRFWECLDSVRRAEAAAPLLDREVRAELEDLRSKAMSELTDRRPGDAPRLEERKGRRVRLDVPFVAQDRFSCSPATLSELCAFWGRPQAQAEVAEAISYDGAPRHRARAWAAAQGWAVVEFRATWESIRAVLDRGLPFALVTRGPLSGHDQAVVGYDEGRGTLLVRCPSQPFVLEYEAKRLFAAQRWCGPQATILLPPFELGRLSGLDLPDREAYDHVHELEQALAKHRREEAQAAARRLARLDPGNRLNLWATLSLARYDSDHAAELECLEALGRAFPGTPALELWRLFALRSFAHPTCYFRNLDAACGRHPSDPALRSHLAWEMSREPQGREHAWRVLRPILRRGYWPTTALNLLTLANLCEAEDRKAWTWAVLSLAAHNDDLKEWLAVAYFRHTQAEGQPEEGLEFLRARFRAHGRLSGEPAETLFDALTAAGRGAEAFAALKEALTLRPHDPELGLFAARAHADHGELEPAITLLEQARGRTHRARWLRAAVKVPVRQGNREEALRLWREVLRLEPDATDAQEAVARLLEALGKPGPPGPRRVPRPFAARSRGDRASSRPAARGHPC